jgi:uncharacterized alpha-E superfamily protein
LIAAGSRAHAAYETAAALERADASARVLTARTEARGLGRASGFSDLARIAPAGLVPPSGRAAAHLADLLEMAAAAAAAAEGLDDQVAEAVGRSAAELTRVAAGSGALDPGGVARMARRAIGSVRGLADHTMPRDEPWQLLRLGTFLTRAGWTGALLAGGAAAGPGGDWELGPWSAIAAVCGAAGDAREADGALEIVTRLLTDRRLPAGHALAVAEVEATLAALSRGAGAGGPAPALARSAASRLRDPGLPRRIEHSLQALLEEQVDAVAAVERAAIGAPRGPEPLATLLAADRIAATS